MILKIIVAIMTKLLGMSSNGDDEPRADMFLPDWLLAFGVVLTGVGIGTAIAFVFFVKTPFLFIAGLCIPSGIGAILCWKNQTIRIIDEYTFEYTTFLGNKKTYAFSDIETLRKNQDSLTLFVKNEKVHIESCAIISDRLADKINEALGIEKEDITEDDQTNNF